MAKFKTPHFEIIAAVIAKQSNKLDYYQDRQMLTDRTVQIMQAQIEAIVNDLCIEFAQDNRLFNETLFRAKCNTVIQNKRSA